MLQGRGFLRALRRCKYLNAGVNKGRRDIYTFGTACPFPWLNDKVRLLLEQSGCTQHSSSW